MPRRRALNALPCVTREGSAWRGVAEAFGDWHRVYVTTERIVLIQNRERPTS